MTQLAIAPMHWAQLPDLDETSRLSEGDFACMQEMKAVLAKHGKLDRFALHLIHKHFDMAEDEVLAEYTNTAKREQTFKVVKHGDKVLDNVIPTTWSLDAAMPTALTNCVFIPYQGHQDM